ncbi:hypothetical protein KC316_g241 [Hortaea werneckii]|nr:hypothetical protein KC324_g286 [Hortaea werneckii]KAI7595864.1 hypothetical protein KC316_g241 [Hortaea werneckii]
MGASPTLSPRVEARANVDDVTSVFQNSGDKTSQVASVIDSEASAVASQATSTAGETTEAAEEKLIKLVGHAFNGTIESLGIRKTYSLHLLRDCTGIEHARGDQGCDIDFLNSVRRALKIIFILASSFTGLTLVSVLVCVGLYKRPQHAQILRVTFLLMSIFTCLAAGISESIASANGTVFDTFSQQLGIESRRGAKFLALAWTADGLLLASTLLWFIAAYLLPQ